MSALTDFLKSGPRELRPRVRALLGEDEAARLAAAEALAASGHPLVPAVLRERIPDPSPAVTGKLLDMLRSLDPRLAREAARALAAGGMRPFAAMGEVALREMIPAEEPIAAIFEELGSEDPAPRGRARKKLEDLCGDREALEEILGKLPEASPAVVRAVLEVAWRKDPGSALKADLAILLGNRRDLLEPAADALAASGKDGAERLAGVAIESRKNPLGKDLQETAASVLVRRHPDWVIGNCGTWFTEEYPACQVRGIRLLGLAAGIALAEAAAVSEAEAREVRKKFEPALQNLVKAIGTLSDNVLPIAIEVCRTHDAPGWREAALSALSSPVASVRRVLIRILARIRESDALAPILDLLADPAAGVRREALKAAVALSPEAGPLLNGIRRMLASPTPEVRLTAIQFLKERGTPECFDGMCQALGDPHPWVARAAFEALRGLAPGPEAWLEQVRRAIRHSDMQIRSIALLILGDHGAPGDIQLIEERLNAPKEWPMVLEAALDAALKLAPDKVEGLARKLLKSTHQSIAERAFWIVSAHCPGGDPIASALQALGKARAGEGAWLLERIVRDAPERLNEALDKAFGSKSDAAKNAAIAIARRRARKRAPEDLRRILGEPESGQTHAALSPRVAAFEGLLERFEGEALDLALQFLEDPNPAIRKKAIELTAKSKDPRILERLLPTTRSESPADRLAALRAVARLDDPRVLVELISSTRDVHPKVAEMARSILQGKQGTVPSLRHLEASGGRGAIARILGKVEEIALWASRMGYDLLGRPVAVRNYRQGLGRTAQPRKLDPVEIEISDTAFVAGHEHGEDILKGLALHEIGHHIFDVGVRGERSHAGKAAAEGFGEIYDWLRDERLERGLRSWRPEWGVYFDRLASYAFAQNIHRIPLEELAGFLEKTSAEVREAIGRGELPGRIVPPAKADGPEEVALADADMLKIPGLVPVQAAFLACLRCGLDPRLHPDPRVAEAISLVPRDLKDLPHREVLAAARRIGEILGPREGFQQGMKAVWNRLERRKNLRSILRSVLDRLGEAGNLPSWLWKEGRNIRTGIQVVYRPPPRSASKGAGGQTLNLGKTTRYPRLENETVLDPDPHGQAALLAPVRSHVRRLRAYLERLGRRTVEEPMSRRGRRIDPGAIPRGVILRSPNLLVFGREELQPDAYLGILIDRSGSMAGTKITAAKTFGALLAESARGIRGIEGHVCAFDDSTFFRLGDFERSAIARLEAGGGNNDAGALERMAELAFRSRRRNKLIITVSDSSPSACSVAALRALVDRLIREARIVLAQVAVNPVDQRCFPHFVDLSRLPFQEAVGRFGKLIARLTAEWR